MLLEAGALGVLGDASLYEKLVRYWEAEAFQAAVALPVVEEDATQAFARFGEAHALPWEWIGRWRWGLRSWGRGLDRFGVRARGESVERAVGGGSVKDAARNRRRGVHPRAGVERPE